MKARFLGRSGSWQSFLHLFGKRTVAGSIPLPYRRGVDCRDGFRDMFACGWAARCAAIVVSLLGVLTLAGSVGAADTTPAPAGLKVVAGHFELVEPLGLVQRGAQLVGVEFAMGTGRFAIEAVERDANDPSGEIELYKIRRLDTGPPIPYCATVGKEEVLAFPMAGIWTAAGDHQHEDGAFSVACAGSAEAKCVELGYRPWRQAPDGTSLWDYHEACVRALRADYCGTGRAHVRDDAPVALYDRIGLQSLRTSSGYSFEAAWGPRGAACVRHPRPPTALTLKDLQTECANLPKTRLGDSCDERVPALVFTKSPDR
jgi:hypothetical protein